MPHSNQFQVSIYSFKGDCGAYLQPQALWRQRQADLRVEDSLVYKVTPCLKTKKQTKIAIQMAIDPNKQFKATAAFL